MPQQSQDPPPERMVRQLNQADHSSGFYSELVSREGTRFQALNPVKRGTRYSSTVGADQTVVDLFGASLVFLKEQVPLGGTEVRGMPQAKWVIWQWGTDQDADNATNSKIEYFSESLTYPVYTRISTVRRDAYESSPTIAYGSALTALISVNVTAGGTGYTSATGAIATGATVEFVILAGAIVEGIVTNEGTGVTDGGSITITGDGTGATATARIQPSSAVLIHQEKEELPVDDPYANEYVRITRVYRQITGPTLTGQDYDPQYDFAFPYTIQETAAGHNVGNNRVEITPIDTVRQKERTVDPGIAAAVFGGYLLSFPGTVSLQLPDVLTNLSTVYETSVGDGTFDETGSAYWDTHGSASLSLRGNGQASAAIMPDVIPTIQQSWGSHLPVTRYIFFLQIPVSTTDVTSKLTALVGATINTWPKFHPTSVNCICTGQRMSIRCDASSQWQDGGSSDSDEHSESVGTGYSEEISLSVKAVRIPPTLHGTISISSSASQNLTADASAEADASVPATVTRNGSVTGSIAASSSATTPTAIPSSGFYLLNTQAEPYRYGYAIIHAEIIDAANI